jgi:diadenosine tetraphosphate (Ap4A) HIT family hydrolase
MSDRAWPADWPQRLAGVNCSMCASLGPADNEFVVGVAELPFSSVGLERRSKLPGYCVVIWRHGHVAEPMDLSPEDAAGYWQDVLDVAGAIRDEFQPLKLNFLTLGNYVPHLHTHVVPRYADDPAPGGPIAWEQMFFFDPAPEARLRRQAAALRSRLGR